MKREKERRKMMETPEEKRARRLMKKQMKNAKEREKMGWTKDIIQYDNDDNPFGDSSLTQPFRCGLVLDLTFYLLILKFHLIIFILFFYYLLLQVEQEAGEGGHRQHRGRRAGAAGQVMR